MNYKFCSHCGKKMDANAIFCPHCGARQSTQINQNPTQRPNFQQPFQPQPRYQQQNYQQPPNQPMYNNNYGYNSNPGYREKIQITPPPCTMKQAWLSFWHQYSRGHGYSSRSEYWLFIVDTIIIYFIGIILASIFYFITPDLSIITLIALGIYYVASIIPYIALTCRRLRDAGVSNGWVIALVIMNFVPYVNLFSGIATFIFTIMPSVRYRN